MNHSQIELTEITLNGQNTGQVRCAPGQIPAPGQYLLAWAEQDTDAPLAVPLFSAGVCAGGFTLANPLPAHWQPGTQLNVRGPLGKGFNIPPSARFIVLVGYNKNLMRLLALTEPALAQNAAVALLTDHPPEGIPAALEISPLATFAEATRWADYLAIDAPRELLPGILQTIREAAYHREGQILIETDLPCGGMAECAACAIHLRKGFKLACKDGPVFDLKALLE